VNLQRRRRAAQSPGTDRHSDQREDGENDCRQGDPPGAAQAVYARDASHKEIYAHDEQREARLGDRVKIVETRPMSKLKRWRLAEVLTRSTRVN